jgi:outer membrane lipoprotein SlyB
MRELTMQEVNQVGGGLTSGEVGGIIGGAVGGAFGVGGAIAGGMIGTAIGDFFNKSSRVNAWNTDSGLSYAMF